MTIERAREILKLGADEASDEMIEKIIELTKQLARMYLRDFNLVLKSI